MSSVESVVQPEKRSTSAAADISPDMPLLGRRLWRGAVIAAAAGVLVYGGMLLYFDADALVEHCRSLTLWEVASLLFVSCINFVFRFVRWQFYLGRLALTVPFAESLLIFLSGFAMSISPGKLGEVLKSVMLRTSVGASLSRTAPIVVAERVTDVAGLVLLGAYGVGVGAGAWWLALGLFVGVLCLGVLVGSRGLVERLCELKGLERVRAPLLLMLEALRDMCTPRGYVLGTLLSVLAWGAHGVTLMLAASHFSGVELGLADAQFAYSAPLVAGTLAMLPGGVGLTEASMTGAIVQSGGAGATAEVAAAITIVVRAVTFWFAVVVGMLALGLWQWRQAGRAALERARAPLAYERSDV